MRRVAVVAIAMVTMGVVSAAPFALEKLSGGDTAETPGITSPAPSAADGGDQSDSFADRTALGEPAPAEFADAAAADPYAMAGGTTDPASGEQEEFEPFSIDGMEYAEAAGSDAALAQFGDAGEAGSQSGDGLPDGAEGIGGKGFGGARAFNASYMGGGGGGGGGGGSAGGGSTGGPGATTPADEPAEWQFWEDKVDPMIRRPRATDENDPTIDETTPQFGELPDSPNEQVNPGNGPGGTPTDAVPAVPEPGTWAMMLIGFGGIGAMLRSRRARATLSASA